MLEGYSGRIAYTPLAAVINSLINRCVNSHRGDDPTSDPGLDFQVIRLGHIPEVT